MIIKQKRLLIFLSSFLIVLSISFFNLATAAMIEGNPKGSITIVDFFDYQCPHCQHMAMTLDQLLKQNKDVRVAYKVVPVLNQNSWVLARAALAAQHQTRSLTFHHLLLFNAIRNQEQLFYLAKRARLNPRLLIHTLDDSAVTSALQQNLADLQALQQVVGVPTLLVGCTAAPSPTFQFNGEVSLQTLQQAIHQLP